MDISDTFSNHVLSNCLLKVYKFFLQINRSITLQAYSKKNRGYFQYFPITHPIKNKSVWVDDSKFVWNIATSWIKERNRKKERRKTIDWTVRRGGKKGRKLETSASIRRFGRGNRAWINDCARKCDNFRATLAGFVAFITGTCQL